ncbi:MAG TPA: SUMF1/EgtB/PvdO family nonheme iron enzyme [Polyangia bacterium]|jgi:hypothetical protein|nr:SUMF1/EgtB/PvdO family nonheme iron enzyme [Polyangia bacterium]
MRIWAGTWRNYLLSSRAKVLLGVGSVALMSLLGGGIYLARAAAGGPTRSALSFAGTLRLGSGPAGPVTLTFGFKKNGSTVCSPAVSVTPDSSGAFQAEIPIASCPSNLFDGSDVVVDVSAGGTMIAANQPINPVPYAKYADQAGQIGDPDCPLGWTKDPTPPNPLNALSVLCRRGPEEIVKVGTGPSSFWIDRYEAIVTSLPDGGGTQNNIGAVPVNGQVGPSAYATPPGYALSIKDRTPATDINWLQANAYCGFSGKRLPTGPEWLRAAEGTPDPVSASSGANSCFTSGSIARKTGVSIGLTPGCTSSWGAEDMIGNVWEWMSEWSVRINGSSSVQGTAQFNFDYLYLSDAVTALARGGSFSSGTGAGIFSLHAGLGPSITYSAVGFRCVIPR